MARVGRLAGAILAETNGEYFLVGNTKAPCDWGRAGFVPPAAIDATTTPYLRLEPVRPVPLAEPYLTFALEGEELARMLADRFVIERNGSVSDRLWRLIENPDLALEPAARSSIDARWLGEIPSPIWRIVRDSVLRCL
jgi:hypothetical protein